MLAIWGANDPFFIPAGAEAYKRDVPTGDVVLDTGHFALVEELEAIAAHVDRFLRSIHGSTLGPADALIAERCAGTPSA